MTAPTHVTDSIWPADVLTFAGEQGLTPYLEPVLEMTRRLFPGQEPEAEMTADYEIPDRRYITIWVDATGLTVNQFGDRSDRWYAGLLEIYGRNNEPRFHLGMEGK